MKGKQGERKGGGIGREEKKNKKKNGNKTKQKDSWDVGQGWKEGRKHRPF